MAPLKILISGAGIAGNALAFWLSRLDYEVTVVERFPGLRATGLQIDLRSHGIEVLRRMGLEKAFRDKAVEEEGIQVIDESGRRRAYFPANKSGDGAQDFTSEFEIMRGDFCRLLHDHSAARTKYIFGTSIESMEEIGDSVEVRFASGETSQFDLVVGADGVGSRTRKMMLGSGKPDGFFPMENLYFGYFTVPRPAQEGEKNIASWHLAPGGRGIMIRRSNPDYIQVYVGGKIDSDRMKLARPGDVEEEKAAMAEALAGRGRQAELALGHLAQAQDFYCERLGLVKLDSWSQGRIVLLGDAAYCPSANTGMGTTSAIVGAYILAGEIGRCCGTADKGKGEGGTVAGKGLAKALAAYEETFSPFMRKIQEGALDGPSSGMLATRFGVAVLTCFLSVASMLRVNVFNLMRKEEVPGWKLPDYEVLAERV